MAEKRITPVEWLPAKSVVGGEATDFTPWLGGNLHLLQEVLGLDELILREIEADVQGKSLDILARGVDQDGNEFPVVIENQYGVTDHRHLGQLVTYLAQYGPGYAVWIVEDGHPALLTALDFLNRTSPDDVNYFLVRVRFTHGSDGGHQVDFQLLIRPDIAAKPRRAGRSKSAKPNEDKVNYLSGVLDRVKPVLEASGYKSVSMHPNGSYIEMRVPIPALDAWDVRVKIFANRDESTVRLYVVNQKLDRAHNSAALDVIRGRYGAQWQAAMPHEEFEWHCGQGGAVGDFVRVARKGAGYVGGSAADAGDWAAPVARGWLEIMCADPIQSLDDPVSELLMTLEGEGAESEDWASGS